MNPTSTLMETPTGVHLVNYQDIAFKKLIIGLLKKGSIRQKYIDILTSQESMEIYQAAFTSDLVNEQHNYQVYEQLGDLTGNKFIVWYIYRRFPQLQCAEGVKVAARLRINYGSKNSFCMIAEKYGFWDFITATNDLRQRSKKALLEDVFESFIGATETILDNHVAIGVGHACVYKILKAIFDDIPISLRYEDLYDAKTRLKELFDIHSDKLGPLRYEERRENLISYTMIYRLDGAKYDTRPDGTLNTNSIVGSYRKVLIGQGSASLKADAEQIAASDALQRLASQGFVKHAPSIYAKFSGDKKIEKVKTTYHDVIRICEDTTKINDLFFTRGKSKYQSKYVSTALTHYCRKRDLDGIQICMDLGANPNILDSDGLTSLDVLLIGSYDSTVIKALQLLSRNVPLHIHRNVNDIYYQPYQNEIQLKVQVLDN